MNDDPPYNIQINNQHTYDCVDDSILRRGIREALRRFDVAAAEVSVAVVTDEEIAELRKKYMNVSGATDVLAFDLADVPNDRQNARHIEGEIVLSADTAMRRAEQRPHSAAAELALYAVHGTLHLLGMDDATEQEAVKMHRLEDEVLTAVGIGRVYGD